MKTPDEYMTKLEQIASQLHIGPKEVLSLNEAAEYLNLSRSALYKLTSARRIPFYRPNGKKIYFRRADLIQWVESKRTPTTTEALEASINRMKRTIDN